MSQQKPADRPTAYRGASALIGGAIVVLFCLGGAIDLLVEAGTANILTVAVMAFVAALALTYGVYPAAFSHEDRLVVRNPFRTIALPWSAVTDITATLSFIVYTEPKRFTVWAIPVSLRDRRRAERAQARDLMRAQRAKDGAAPDAARVTPKRFDDPLSRLTFADQALAEMADRREARQSRLKSAAAPEDALAVSIRWSWPTLALVIAATTFVVLAATV
jgi:hypothetical protein